MKGYGESMGNIKHITKYERQTQDKGKVWGILNSLQNMNDKGKYGEY